MMTVEELRSKLRGPIVAMTTPFNQDLSLDLDGLRRLTEFYIESGIETVIAGGSTGEFFSLTDEERKEVIKTVVDVADGRMTVIAGTTHSGTQSCIDLTRYAEDVGADGAMVTPPYYGYNGGGFSCLCSHFDKVTRATNIGIVVYFSGVVLPLVSDILAKPDMMLDLVDACNGNASGFKDSSGNYPFYRDVSLLLKDRVSVMGSAGMNYFYWGFKYGSPCSLTGLGNIWPSVEIEFHQHLLQGEDAKAMEIIMQKDLPYLRACTKTRRYWACVKALLDMSGLPGGPVRGPLLAVEPADREMLGNTCAKMGLLESPERLSAVSD